MKSHEPWTIRSEQVLFEAKPYVSIVRQHVVTQSGREVDDYHQILLPDFVIACALTQGGKVITLWQYKHGARRFGLTFPAGHIEAGELPEAAIRRELLEETGYTAGRVQFLGKSAVNANQGCGFANMFLVEDCVRSGEACSGDLETMELRLMSIAEVDDAICSQAVWALAHLAVWGIARANGLGKV